MVRVGKRRVNEPRGPFNYSATVASTFTRDKTRSPQASSINISTHNPDLDSSVILKDLKGSAKAKL